MVSDQKFESNSPPSLHLSLMQLPGNSVVKDDSVIGYSVFLYTNTDIFTRFGLCLFGGCKVNVLVLNGLMPACS